VLALAAAFLARPIYRSRASFVTAGTAIRLPSSLAGFASQLGISPGGSDPSVSPSFYVELLRSRELLTRLVESRFPDPTGASAGDSATLVQLFGIHAKDPQRALEIAIKKVAAKMRVEADARTNLVFVSAEARWPSLSAAIANRAVELVSAFNVEQRQSRARARRVFVESRVGEALIELRAAENSLRAFYEQNRQWQGSPALIVEEGRLRRQVEVANEIYLTLRREFESARIDEVNDTPVITVVDAAVPPRLRSWPRRTLMMAVAMFVGIGFGLFFAGILELGNHWRVTNPAQARILQESWALVRREMRGTLAMLRRERAGTVDSPHR
jgi:uncharacterized protein involved in exopolysaccharide biosynthesis